MMSVPECLKRLLANFGMRGRIHKKHAEQHDMASNTAWLRIMNLDCSNRANLGPFDVEEVDVMTGDVDDGPEEHGVCDLSMEPLRLIERQNPDLRSDPS